MGQEEISRKIQGKVGLGLLYFFFLLSSTAWCQSGFYEKQWLISVDYGRLWEMTSVDKNQHPALQDYEKDLNRYNSLSIGLDYFFSENQGVGFVYNDMRTSASLADVTVIVDTTVYRDVFLKDEIRTRFYGFFYKFRKQNQNGRICYHIGGAIGYLDYWHRHQSIAEFEERGFNMGVMLSASLSFYLAKGLDLSISGVSLLSQINEVEIAGNQYLLAEPIGITRLGATIGLKLSF